jgi:exonuclease III
MVEDSPEEKERKHRLDKRRRVIQELLETEVSYSKDMLLLQEVHMHLSGTTHEEVAVHGISNTLHPSSLLGICRRYGGI